MTHPPKDPLTLAIARFEAAVAAFETLTAPEPAPAGKTSLIERARRFFQPPLTVPSTATEHLET